MLPSPYLCVMHLLTAGQQGEEEVLFLWYVVVDMRNKEVAGSYYFSVNPMRGKGDPNQNRLYNQLMAEWGLEENTVNKGQSLEVAIQQFETYMKDKYHSVRLITDGQFPLRQCLHPQALSKNFKLGLPASYGFFHDIRKEFKQFYKVVEDINSVESMESYLGLSPGRPKSEDVFIKEMKDMVEITQGLLAGGHNFNNPEKVSFNYEPGLCSKTEPIGENCVVRVRGLPWKSSEQDIAKFFRGLTVAKGGIAICLNTWGQRTGEGFIRFVSEEHRNLALKRNNKCIAGRYIEIYGASKDEFISIAAGNYDTVDAFLSRGAQVVVRMRGLPYYCSTKQILEFFENDNKRCKVMDGEEGILFVIKPSGQPVGDAFILFAQEEYANEAVLNHNKVLGKRYIEVFISSIAEVQQILNRSLDPKTYVKQQSGIGKDCIRLSGLPYEAQVTDIVHFLGEHIKSTLFNGIQILNNTQGQPSGVALIHMDSEQSACIAASKKDHCNMRVGCRQRYIKVSPCSSLSKPPSWPPRLYNGSFPLVQPVQALVQPQLKPSANSIQNWPVSSLYDFPIASSPFSTSTQYDGTQYASTVPLSGNPSHPMLGQYPFLVNPPLELPPPVTAFHPSVLPFYIPTQPPPPLYMLPSASGLLRAKRSWDQAFPKDLQTNALDSTQM